MNLLVSVQKHSGSYRGLALHIELIFMLKNSRAKYFLLIFASKLAQNSRKLEKRQSTTTPSGPRRHVDRGHKQLGGLQADRPADGPDLVALQSKALSRGVISFGFRAEGFEPELKLLLAKLRQKSGKKAHSGFSDGVLRPDSHIKECRIFVSSQVLVEARLE